ncbi:hypothetical protein Asi02nite_40040 [Asanoa siamensis]|uniref:Uncharacterized protein n=1 Tax=Asanoa siamensis TaxID=926357 RepID=A0ABQ4CT65_9ACTN|nr:hypothetical protein Asi02nite_40040 [Asanoa siamensis]
MFGDSAATGKGEPQVADRLVRELARRPSAHGLVDESLCLAPLVGEDQPPDLGQRGGALRVAGVVGPPGPHRVLVELQAFDVDVAEHHRTEASVADRQRPQPVRAGAFVVPEREVVGGPDRRGSGGRGARVCEPGGRKRGRAGTGRSES